MLNNIIKYIGITGFFICLAIMYFTNHGIRGLRKFDANFRLLDMQFHYTTADVYRTFEKLGSDGRLAYRNYWILDFFFIPCFLIVMLAIIYHMPLVGWVEIALIILSILRALFDVIENSILLYLISKYPAQDNLLATVCSWITTSKFIALFLWMLGIAAMLIYSLTHRSN